MMTQILTIKGLVSARGVAAGAALVTCAVFLPTTVSFAQQPLMASELDAMRKAYSENPHDHQSRVAFGLALVQDRQYVRGERLLSAAYRKEKSDEIEIALGQSQYALGQYQSALDVLRRVGGDVNAERTKALLRLEILLRLRRFHEVVEYADASEPDAPALAFASARAHYGLGDTNRAISLLDDVLRAGYSLPEAWLFRGRIALNQNETNFARKALRRSVDAGMPENAVAYFSIEADIRDGSLAKASNDIRAWQVNSKGAKEKNVGLLYASGLLAAAKEDFVQATRDFEQISQWLASEPRGLLLMAEVKIQTGALAQGEALLRRHITSAPDDWRALDMMAALNIRKKFYADALVYAGLYENSPSKPVADQAIFRRFQVYVLQKKFDDAYELLKENARGERGEVEFQSTGRLLFGSTFETSDNVDDYFAVYSDSLVKLRSYYSGDIVETSELVASINTPDQSPLLSLVFAELLSGAGRDDEAGLLLDRVVELSPDFLAARNFRRRIDVRRGNFGVVEKALEKLQTSQQTSNAEIFELATARLNAGDISGAQELFGALDRLDEFGLSFAAAKDRALRAQNDNSAYRKLAREIAARGDDPAHMIFAAQMMDAANETDAAIKFAKRAVSSAPDSLDALNYFANVMKQHGGVDEGKRFLEALVRRRSNLLNARYAVAKLAVILNDTETVEAQLSALKEAKAPQASWVEIYRLLHAGETQLVGEAMKTIALAKYDRASLAVEASEIAVSAGALESAEVVLRNALTAAPDDVQLVSALAKLQFDNNLAGSLSSAQKLYRLSDAAPEALAIYAVTLWRDNQSEEALAISREAVWAGLPVERYSLALAEELKAHAYESLSGAILRQIRSNPLSGRDRESAEKLLESLTRIQAQPDEFKRLRG